MAKQAPVRSYTTRARNSHVVDVARRSLNAAAPIIQQQTDNSIAVAGIPVQIYTRKTSGDTCSCSLHIDLSAPTQYDEEGNASTAVLLSIAHQATYGIEDYNPSSLTALPLELTAPIATELGVGTGTETGEEDLSNLIEQPVSGYSAGACAVCMGSGIKGGYDILGGSRVILDHTDLSAESVGIEVTRTSLPVTLKVTAGASAVFYVHVPPGAVLFDLAAIRAGFSLADEQDVAVITDGTGFSCRLSQVPKFLRSKQFKGGLCKIVVTHADYFEFTHIELQWMYTRTPFYADFPKVSQRYDPNRVKPFDPVNLVISAKVPQLNAWDVICDPVHNLKWMVETAVCTAPSQTQTAWYQEIDARCVDPHEPQYYLSITQNVKNTGTANMPRWHIGGV